MKYKRYTLKELATIKYGKNQAKVVTTEKKYPIYGTGGLMGYATQFLYDKPSVLIGRKGTIDKIRYVEHPFWTVDTLFYTEINTDLVMPEYFYYALSLVDLAKHNEGTTIPSLRTDTLNKIEFDIPDIEDQRRIIGILRPISDKIALNEKINNNLMHVASSLFTKALEDNADTLIATPLGEIADVKGGKRLPKGINLQSVPNSHPYIRVRDLTNTAIIHINDDFEYVDDDTQRGISRYIVATNDVLLSTVGTIGLVSIVHPSLDKANLTENCVKLTNLKGITPQYLFLYLRSSDGQHEIARSTVGAVQAKLPIKNIQAINVPVLTSTQGKTLCETLNPLFSNMESLVAEIYSLTRLKNTLLPKLLSGEIDVSEAEF